MTRIYVLVEGQTEEAFLDEVMVAPYANRAIYLTPIIVSTSVGHRGGVVSYAKVRPQIERLCRQDPNAHVTTFFDFYGLPKDFPGQAGIADNAGVMPARTKAQYLEQQLALAIDRPNFIPNLILHEFEALLLTNIDAFVEWTNEPGRLSALRQVRQTLAPEDINDNVHTAPSKRILSAVPGYQKPVHGPLIAAGIGLDAIRAACPHFNDWLSKLDDLSGF